MKLIQTLKLLPKKEYKTFDSFLRVEMFNKRHDVIALFSHIQNQDNLPLKDLRAYQAVYGRAALLDKKKWHLVCSRLLKILEDYFSHRILQTHQIDRKIYLADFYRDNQRMEKFKKSISEAEAVLNKTINRSEVFWKVQHQLAETNYDYVESQNRTNKTNLQEVSDTLDIFFIISKLKLGCRKISRAIINSEEYDIAMLDLVLEEIGLRKKLLEIPAIAVYYYCYKAIAPEGSELDFQALRININQHKGIFSAADLRDIYLIAINYCIRKINMGAIPYFKEAFELYRLSLEDGLLLEDGVFPESTYNNIVSLAIHAKEFVWGEKFIDEYQWRLKNSLRDSVHSFCMGKIYFAQSKFDESLSALSKISTNIPFIYLGARTIQLKIYYENKSWDALDSLIDSLRVYIQRHKDMGYRKENYRHLIAFTKRLLQLTVMSKSDKEQFAKDIHAAEVFTEKEWFLSKIHS